MLSVLDSTSFAPKSELGHRFVQGYKKRGREASHWDLESFNPAGGLKSCVSDLLTYVRAHVDPADSPLATPLIEVQRPRVYIRKGRLAVGLSWLVAHQKEMTITWHGGGTGGFSSFAGFSGETGVSVVALANAQIAGPLVRSGNAAIKRIVELSG